MITPLKCLIEMSQNIGKILEREDLRHKQKLITNTGEILLNQVKGNLDKNLLDNNLF
jgi:hypothetical protein